MKPFIIACWNNTKNKKISFLCSTTTYYTTSSFKKYIASFKCNVVCTYVSLKKECSPLQNQVSDKCDLSTIMHTRV